VEDDTHYCRVFNVNYFFRSTTIIFAD